MRLPIPAAGAVILLLTSLVSGSAAASSHEAGVIPVDFNPPMVFKHTNLLRTIDLTKPYVKETVAAIVENVSNKLQTEYFLPFPRSVIPHISSVEAKDKKGDRGTFEVEHVDFNSDGETQYYRIFISPPLAPGDSLTLSVTSIITSTLRPVPSTITQTEAQFLVYDTPKRILTPYTTEKQKTKFRFPNAVIPGYTKFPALADGTDDPALSGPGLTYGPYAAPTEEQAEKEASQVISVRYDHTGPLTTILSVERDIEVSHWGGNLATEERYSLINSAALLKDQFSRVTWTSRSYHNAPSAALKHLNYPLHPTTTDVYYTDEIGNVTTSRFRSSPKEAHIQLTPRYPVFGGWNYTFVVGWNNPLSEFLRQSPSNPNEYILRVPFLLGPTEPALTYNKVVLRIILPEGATDVSYVSPIPLVSQEEFKHQTYMDTLGRTAIRLEARNLVEEVRGKDVWVKYTYEPKSALRKPLTVAAGTAVVFFVSWIVGKIDVGIGRK
ncbi:Ribophorin I [Peziza echinospora]|nr:Ribophorin I [Peziza echinospora]